MDAADLYLNLLEGCLTRSLFLDEETSVLRPHGWKGRVWDTFKRYTNHEELILAKPITPNAQARSEGRGVAEKAETSIGHLRLDNIRECVTRVLEDEIPGDLIETGVQRGGAAILMRAVLAVRGAEDRNVWMADTFEGMPQPNPDKYAADAGLTQVPGGDPRAIGVQGVKANFARYGLLDDKVRFVVGLFKDTLPTVPVEQLAVVRLDGDYYESTMDGITALYPKLSVGGYLIVDDYNSELWGERCGQAIRDYRAEQGITEPLQEVDWNAVYWRRER